MEARISRKAGESDIEKQQPLIDKGRQQLRRQGGGELVVKGRDGKVRAQDTVPKGNDPRRSKG